MSLPVGLHGAHFTLPDPWLASVGPAPPRPVHALVDVKPVRSEQLRVEGRRVWKQLAAPDIEVHSSLSLNENS